MDYSNPWQTPINSARGGGPVLARPLTSGGPPPASVPASSDYRPNSYASAYGDHPSPGASILAACAASAAAAASATASAPSSFHPPTRSSARAQMLRYAESIGLHGWLEHAPSEEAAKLSASTYGRRGNMPAQFTALPCHSIGDHTAWLAQSSSLFRLLRAHHDTSSELQTLEDALSEHEREQDVNHVMAKGEMEEWARAAREWSQHIAAMLSSQREPRVAERDPQPSNKTLSSAAKGGSNFTAAPVSVHPLLRTLLQPPLSQSSRSTTPSSPLSSSSRFLHVEPEKQAALVEGVETMCRDVARWRGAGKGRTGTAGRKEEEEKSNAGQQPAQEERMLTPPEALAWTSTLAAQQQPLDSTLHSIASNWSRLSRVADGLSSTHAITRQLHEQDRAMERRRKEIEEEEREWRKVDRGQFKAEQ